VVPIHHHPHPIHVFHPASPRAAYYGAATSQFKYYGGSVKNAVVTSQVEPDPNPPQPVAGKERGDNLSDDVIQQIIKQFATALRTSSKLVVSDDGKKVKHQLHFTEADMEELQSRIVVAENLPEDHCYHNLIKIFLAIGSVKTIRTCYPQTFNGTSPATNRSAKLVMFFLQTSCMHLWSTRLLRMYSEDEGYPKFSSNFISNSPKLSLQFTT
jgi:hypothetical protein